MGKRGEVWFLLQMLLFAVIFFAPQATCFACPSWLKGVGLAILAAGGILGTWGMLALGRNLTPFPKPIEGGELVTHGPYRFVRHPIYAGLIFGTLGFFQARWPAHSPAWRYVADSSYWIYLVHLPLVPFLQVWMAP